MCNGCHVAEEKVIDLNEPSFKVCDLCFHTCFQFSFMVSKAFLSDRAFSDNMEKNKGSNFTTAETTALLEGVRANYQALFGAFSGPGQSSLSSKLKNKIWADITKQVNATGSGQRRNMEQVRLRWKNLKQKATKDHSEAKKNPNRKQGHKM